ncbi:MAG: hypothetical protein K6D55_08535 [Prevotella sp.]|nr:hypothetical protein [Prevotella sp.]
MKKTLLMMFALLFSAGAFAIEKGEYIFSNAAKYKVVGDNVVTNGTFSVGDGSEGWKNDLGAAMGATWKVVTSAGPNGENAIESQGASTTEGDALCNSWELTSGLYTISYYVYSAEDAVSTITAGSTNYVNFTAAAPGTETQRAIASAESWKGGQWTQIVDTIFVNTDMEVLSFNANNVAEGIRFTGFEIHQALEVYDSRIIDRLIDYAEKLLQEPDLAVGRDDFAGIMEMMKEAIADPASIEDKDAAQALIDAFNEAFDEFMNQNGGNTKDTTGDWTTVAGKNWNNLKNANFVGSYWTVGDRWGFFPNAPFARNSAGDMADLERKEGDGYILTAGIQSSMDLGVKGVRLENADLKPGKYFFAIEAQAVAAGNKSAPYGENHNLPFVGPTISVGKDTLVLENDTLSGYYWKRYYFIGEVPEGKPVTASFLFPGYSDKRGGKISLRNPEFRLLGKTEVQINYEAALANAFVQQTEAKKRLETYPADVESYKWAKDSLLTKAIPLAQEVYNNSLQYVLEDGTSPLPITVESVDILKSTASDLLEEAVRRLNRAKDYVIAQNAVFANLLTAIQKAKDVLADDFYQDGDKATLQAAIATAQSAHDNTYASTTDETREADEPALQAAIEALNQAVEDFKVSAHVTPIVDIDFSNPFILIEGEEGDSDALKTYAVNGAAGTMNFVSGGVDTDLIGGAIKYMLGYQKNADTEAVLTDVLRVGPSEATVDIPAVGDDEVLRVGFDLWFGKLVGKYLRVELRNEANEKVAGFSYDSYNNAMEYNEFDNEEKTGMVVTSYATGIGSSSQSNDVICGDNNKTSFELIVDYKTQALKGIINNPQKGNCNGAAVAFPEVADTKITKFVLSSNYNNADRRCWFDNLKIYKYKSGGSLDGIDTVNASENAAQKGVFTLSGVQLTNSKNLPAGLYIINGKKVLVK